MTRLGLTGATTCADAGSARNMLNREGREDSLATCSRATALVRGSKRCHTDEGCGWRAQMRRCEPVTMFVIAYSGTEANSGERCFKYVAGRLSLKTIHLFKFALIFSVSSPENPSSCFTYPPIPPYFSSTISITVFMILPLIAENSAIPGVFLSQSFPHCDRILSSVSR